MGKVAHYRHALQFWYDILDGLLGEDGVVNYELKGMDEAANVINQKKLSSKIHVSYIVMNKNVNSLLFNLPFFKDFIKLFVDVNSSMHIWEVLSSECVYLLFHCFRVNKVCRQTYEGCVACVFQMSDVKLMKAAFSISPSTKGAWIFTSFNLIGYKFCLIKIQFVIAYSCGCQIFLMDKKYHRGHIEPCSNFLCLLRGLRISIAIITE